jgi:hypothetical protein
MGGEVAVTLASGAAIDARAVATDVVAIECPAASAAIHPVISLRLGWWGRQPVEFHLPYPQRGAMFLAGTKMLAQGEAVPVARCGGLRLLVLDPAGGRCYELDGELVGTRFGFQDRLPALQSGRIELSLHAWQDRLSALLASSDDPDARIRLSVKSSQQPMARVVVTRFDVTLDPVYETSHVYVGAQAQARLGDGWQQRVSLAMLPLWDPGAELRPLERCSEDPACWTVPDDLAAGPWWVIARDGQWARFRPLLWVIDDPEGESATADSTLAGAIRESIPEARHLRLSDVLTQLGENPEHPDWPVLFAAMQLTREFPPSVLDLLRQLAMHPQTLALALLKADEDTFDRIWALADGLPFLWWLIPVEHWFAAVAYHLTMVQEALGDADPQMRILESVFQEFRDRAEARHPFFDTLCDWLQERLLPDRPMGGSLLRAIRGQPAIVAALLRQAEQGLQERHAASETWPVGAAVLEQAESMAFADYRFQEMADPFRPTRCAPFVAADAALRAIPCDCRLVLELRLIRSFDPDWFDEVFTVALTLGLASM